MTDFEIGQYMYRRANPVLFRCCVVENLSQGQGLSALERGFVAATRANYDKGESDRAAKVAYYHINGAEKRFIRKVDRLTREIQQAQRRDDDC